MQRILLVAALAVMTASSAWADTCTDNPKASIKQAEQSLKAQSAKLTKQQKQAASGAINKAKMANKFGNTEDACVSLQQAQALLGLTR